jgi:hypothetical protein
MPGDKQEFHTSEIARAEQYAIMGINKAFSIMLKNDASVHKYSFSAFANEQEIKDIVKLINSQI